MTVFTTAVSHTQDGKGSTLAEKVMNHTQKSHTKLQMLKGQSGGAAYSVAPPLDCTAYSSPRGPPATNGVKPGPQGPAATGGALNGVAAQTSLLHQQVSGKTSCGQTAGARPRRTGRRGRGRRSRRSISRLRSRRPRARLSRRSKYRRRARGTRRRGGRRSRPKWGCLS